MYGDDNTADYSELLGEAIFARSQAFDHMTASIIDLVPHVTKAIANTAKTAAVTADDIKWNTVDVITNDEDKLRYLVLTGILKVDEHVMQLSGKIPMSVVLECDQSKIEDYFESQRRMRAFNKAVKTKETTVH